jgi:hypothetical protein
LRLALGSDHAGFELKKQLAAYLVELEHGVVDMETHSTEPVDYPDVAESVAMALIDKVYGDDRVFAYVRLESEPGASQDAAVDAMKLVVSARLLLFNGRSGRA